MNLTSFKQCLVWLNIARLLSIGQRICVSQIILLKHIHVTLFTAKAGAQRSLAEIARSCQCILDLPPLCASLRPLFIPLSHAKTCKKSEHSLHPSAMGAYLNLNSKDCSASLEKRQADFENAKHQPGAKIELNLACAGIPKLVREKKNSFQDLVWFSWRHHWLSLVSCGFCWFFSDLPSICYRTYWPKVIHFALSISVTRMETHGRKYAWQTPFSIQRTASGCPKWSWA